MHSGFDFSTAGWVFIVCGGLMMLGAAVGYRSLRGTPLVAVRRGFLPTMLFALGILLHGIVYLDKKNWDGPEPMLEFIALAFMIGSSLIWIVVFVRHRREKLRRTI